jgi:hypothetical protein
VGMNLGAVLAYGYDLGGRDAGWKVEGGETLRGMVSGGFEEMVERRLLAMVGFTEQWRDDPDGGFYTREREAGKRLRVELAWTGSLEYPAYMLVIKDRARADWSPEVVDIAALAAKPKDLGWDELLDAAVRAIGLKPTQERPAWLIAPTYSH